MMPFSMKNKRNHEDAKARRYARRRKLLFRVVLRVFVSSWSQQRQSSCAIQTQSCTVVAAGLHLFAPVAMLHVPARRRGEAVLERVARRPPELAADLRRVDRVAPVVTGTVGDERFQIAV